MGLFITAIICIGGLLALAKINISYSARAFSVCRNLALAFIKSAQVLFYDCKQLLLALVLILLACRNHFVIDYDIIFLFSSMILIIYHTLKLSKDSSVIL